MSSLSTLPKGDSAWLLRKSIQRIMQQVSVLETNIGSSTTGNSSDTQIIFNDAGTLRGDSGLTYNKTTDLLSVGAATISGDLTVDTSTLKVDSANNRVGVNTASPATDLEVRSIVFTEGTIRLYSAIDGSTASPKGSYFSFRSGTTGGGTETARLSSLNRFANVLGGDFSISTADTSSVMQNRLTIDSGGVFTFAVGGSTAMTLNSTGLGVGGSPGYKLDVAGSSAGVLRLVNINNLSTDPAAVTRLSLDGQGATWHLDNERTNGIFKITRNSTACLTIDNSGNVGIGVTPSAWNNTYNVLDIGQNGSISGRTSTNNSIDIVSNGFRNSGGTWVYKLATSNAASRYLIDGATGGHLWYSGAAGTAGNTIAGFSTATMTLDASGNLDLAVGNLKVSNGKGIDFSATPSGSGTMTSELLSDYEEGTWTGTLTGATTNPTTPVTATGRYTKIGRQVSIQIQFTNVDTTGASGQIKVTGAPFTNNSSVSSTGSVLLSSIGTFTGVPAAFIGTGTTEIELYAFSSAGAQTFVTHNAGTARSLWVSLTYTV